MTETRFAAEPLAGGGLRVRGPLTFGELAAGLCEDAELRRELTAFLADAPLEALFLEVAPFTVHTLDEPLELVVLDAPALLAPPPDRTTFAEPFAGADGSVATFPSLGGDALMVAPVPRADEAWAHLAAFVRSAPPAIADELWRAVGEAVLERLDHAPLWLSTSGLGVAWLHVRLDTRPKYYQHADYRRFPR